MPTYGEVPGFDFEKLSGTRPYDSAQKYSDSVRNFSEYLGGGGQLSRNNLGGAVDFAKSKGFNASAVGDDKIDYGDGRGGIDVVRSDGQLWFNNMPGQEQAPQPGPGGMTTDVLKRLIQQMQQGQNPFQGMAGTQPVNPPGTNPFTEWMAIEQKNNQAPPKLDAPQVDQEQMIQQALMRAFLGGR